MQNTQETMETRIKRVIIERIGLTLSVEDIDDEILLFDVDDNGVGLDLDSVDALELVVGIRQEFDVKIQNTDLSVCKNVRSIAEFLHSLSGE